MHIQFVASQSIEIAVPEEPVPIQHYLRQPQRLVQALVDPTRLESLGSDCFRLKMRPLSFLMLSIQPTVDMQVWATSDGVIHLRSIASEIRGVAYINQRFALNLVGQLAATQVQGQTCLQGQADLTVHVELPTPLDLTPKPLLDATGNGLLKSVLLTIKQRLMHQLPLDYRRWADSPTEVALTAPVVPIIG
ncbi:hypothetical protein DO97_05640 [Neosynechococcus sphagnicola sy1]|uniref:DUF1997 domain-containing protein n=1 Tax=Neosynechococcus sphagnicola sy1 TaxID=1497020 RepID=A0A098TSV5_9CYAN|nr:DUF1997 domain-containing protein [Neosynechococcus sphagnicola]KGF73858.1 hypothetical protein DO97_05640 [Neosynechococcus sphagnicola sy1]